MVTSKTSLAGAGILALCLLIMTGCTPRELETTPVRVATQKGDVICQLYTLEMVYWDRAIHVPAGMNPDEADRICRARGDEIAAEIKTHKP